MTKVDFFISYTKADEEWAKWIAWELKKQRLTFVIQALDFKPGGNFIHQMRTAIKKSRQTIAVLSPDYLKSKFAAAELNATIAADPLGEKGKVVPVRVRECSPKELMRDKVYIDLVGMKEQEAGRVLIAGIKASQIGIRQAGEGQRFKRRPSFPGSAGAAGPVAAAQSNGGNGSAAETPPKVLRVLFLGSAANSGLDLRGQFAEIKAAVKRSPHARAVRLSAVFDLTAETFLDALNKHTPHVLHFSGKQDRGDILINNEAGGVTTISDMALAGLLRSLDAHIRLAIIDTCYSWRCARSVSEVVDCAVGVKSYVYEEDATRYYATFYGALASGRSLRDAWGKANAALQFARVPQNQIPQLIPRRGVDPSKIVLVSKEKPPAR